MTANLREWRHFFNVRAAGIVGKPHPQMLEITIPMLREFKNIIPIIFDDILTT
jgi:thymidylate synthase (FAD)